MQSVLPDHIYGVSENAHIVYAQKLGQMNFKKVSVVRFRVLLHSKISKTRWIPFSLHFLVHFLVGFGDISKMTRWEKYTKTRPNKKIQQSWQTSALAMHLALAR